MGRSDGTILVNWVHKSLYSLGTSVTEGCSGGVWKDPHSLAVIWHPSRSPHTFFSVRSSINRHPKEYMSTDVDRFAEVNISGALYGIVPAPVPLLVLIVASFSCILATPRSQT